MPASQPGSLTAQMIAAVKQWSGAQFVIPVRNVPPTTLWFRRVYGLIAHVGNYTGNYFIVLLSANLPRYAAVYVLDQNTISQVRGGNVTDPPTPVIGTIAGRAPNFFYFETPAQVAAAARAFTTAPATRQRGAMLPPIRPQYVRRPFLFGIFDKKGFGQVSDANAPGPVDAGGGGGGTLQEAAPTVFTEAPPSPGGGGGGGGSIAPAPATPASGGGGPDWTTVGLVGAGVVGAGLVGAALLRKHGGKIAGHARRARATVMRHARRITRRR